MGRAGLRVRTPRILGAGPGAACMRQRRASVATAKWPTIRAISPPMQERGPAPKGNAA